MQTKLPCRPWLLAFVLIVANFTARLTSSGLRSVTLTSNPGKASWWMVREKDALQVGVYRGSPQILFPDVCLLATNLISVWIQVARGN